MPHQISIPIELKERHKTIVQLIGETGPLDRKVVREVFAYCFMLEQPPADTVEVLYDALLSIQTPESKLPFKYSSLDKIFDQEIFAMTNLLELLARVNLDYRGRAVTAFDLTPRGREIHRLLGSGRRAFVRPIPRDRRSIHVLADFTKTDVDQLYDRQLAPACIEVGYKPERVSSADPASDVSKNLFKELSQCEALVVDISGLTPELYFQIGFAHGMGVIVVMTCRVSSAKTARELAEKMPLFGTGDLTILYWGLRKDGAFGWRDNYTPLQRLREIL